MSHQNHHNYNCSALFCCKRAIENGFILFKHFIKTVFILSPISLRSVADLLPTVADYYELVVNQSPTDENLSPTDRRSVAD